MHGNEGVARASSRPSRNRVVKANGDTPAAKWNARTMRRLQDALTKNPEADLSTLLPSTYSRILRSQETAAQPNPATRTPHHKTPFRDNDVRSRLDAAHPSKIIFELSTELKNLISNGDGLSQAIVKLLARSEVLYESSWAASVMVFRVSQSIVVKITEEQYASSEYRSLSYLHAHLPTFPAPKPHGVVRLGTFCLLFTTFVPGLDLEKVWPQLGESQKRSISRQLDALFFELRSLPFPDNTPLGGVQGDGCKDARRGLRVNSEPILNVKQFEDFVFSGSKTASPLYIRFLRGLLPETQAKCVFTHGDVRPANIMVDRGEDGIWKVVAVIDWEAAGFYPEYWECVKMTNNLTPRDNFDWYEYLPESISPQQYRISWLVDRLWDRSLVNS